MAYTILEVGQIRGETRTIADTDSESSAEVPYIVIPDSPIEVVPDASEIPGLPALGSEHPATSLLILDHWTSSEQEDGHIRYTAFYVPKSYSFGTTPDPSSEEGVEMQETSRVWRGTRYQAQLTHDQIDGLAVLLPTGEPYESVPSIDLPGLEVVITRKTNTPPANWLEIDGTLNMNQVTIDDITIPAHCGRASISVSRNYDGGQWEWTVTITVEIRHNWVKLSPNEEAIDIGHDIALMLQGYKVKNNTSSTSTGAIAAKVYDPETQTEVPTQTPVLLDYDGNEYTPSTVGQAYYQRYASAKEALWVTGWFATPSLQTTEEETE